MILTVEDLVAADPRPELLFFYGSRGRGVGPRVLSQWAAAPFEVDGVRYLTAEHYMMASKARLFGDLEAVAAILSSKSPVRAKAIGRSVRGFNPTRWNARRLPVVVSGSLAKFRNPELRAYLATTAPAVLVEAAPRDLTWGIGLAASDPRSLDPSTWRGLNLLGFALTHVREVLCQSSS